MNERLSCQEASAALDLRALEDRHTSGAYAKRPLMIVRGEGCTLYDEAGRAYLDLGSGIGVALLGHGHPAVAQAVAQQAQTLITCPEAFYNDRRAELYALLAELLPGGLERFFLCSSGTEAVEAALKIARLLTGRRGIVSLKRGFHGRTLGALATTWNPQYRQPFDGWVPESQFASPNDLASAEALITEDTAAVFVEVVQGEGGIYPLDADYLRGLRALCTARGALLIADEIQAGLGRTGRWFAFQHAEIVPDMVTLGKGIAGGLPMGAVAWRAELGQIESGVHGSTFGGNPLVCAAAIAALSALRAIDAPARSAALGGWLLDELRRRSLRGVREVRGLGLMVGVELRGRVTPALQALQARGVIALPAGKTTLRLLPPLVITQAQLADGVDALQAALEEAAL
jgi:acetylornithine/LysW-gamma-L-lysine aminotransferase